jgi:hypothetical protein
MQATRPEARDMDTDARQALAQRIHLLLRRELGQGIDVARTLADALYARDVLLVCDAMTGSELASLALQYRGVEPPAARASAADVAAPSGPPSLWPQNHADFAASGPAGQDTAVLVQRSGIAAAPRHWLSPSRWLGRN